MGRTKGSTDGKPRSRTTKSAADKERDADARNQKKARDEAAQKERNGANFRAALFRHSNPPASVSKKPLFNARAWRKANNVLKEILLGYYSDPPGFSFYTNRLDKQGEPMVDQFRLALLNCNRGTNDVEAIHKQLVALYGTWCTGVEMSDALLSDRRHRYNQKINERKRLGFPKFGRYDTWKIDALQLLVERNHDVLLYPEWSNASDYKETAESFGTVAPTFARTACSVRASGAPC
jgi:hypothetical protein